MNTSRRRLSIGPTTAASADSAGRIRGLLPVELAAPAPLLADQEQAEIEPSAPRRRQLRTPGQSA